MSSLTVSVIDKVHEIIDTHPVIRTIPGNKAKVRAIEDDVVGIKLESVELLVKQGVVRADCKEMNVISLDGRVANIRKYNNWYEFISM